MKPLPLLLALLLTALTAPARTLSDTLPPLCDSFVYHLRLKASPASSRPVTIATANGLSITVDVPSLADAADSRTHLTPYTLTLDSTEIARGKAAVTIDPAEKGFSIRLSASPTGLEIALGGPAAEASIPLPAFHTARAARITARIPDKTQILRHTLRAQALAAPERAPFASPDSLLAYLAASSDPREGLYTYLDKDIPAGSPAAISHPEAYRLAVTRDPHRPDAYIIIYLDGPAPAWQPLEIKGRLAPTVFTNHFNLSWTDSARRTLPAADTYAQYSENASILTLSFPLLQASFRLSRVPLR